MKNRILKILAFSVTGGIALFGGWHLLDTAIAPPVIAQETVRQTTSENLEKANETVGYTLLSLSEIAKAFEQIPKTPPTNKKIIDEKYYNVAVAQVTDRDGQPELHTYSDRVFFIREGSAVMRIGGKITDPHETAPNEIRSKSGTGYTGFREVKIEAGAILSIPRNVTYQILAKGADISFIVVRMN